MKTPYDVLKIEETADDTEIRQAYLGMVRRYPPERDAEMFQKIYAAYDLISTEEKRLATSLFYCSLPTHVDLADLITAEDRKAPLFSTPEEFKQLLADSLDRYCQTFTL